MSINPSRFGDILGIPTKKVPNSAGGFRFKYHLYLSLAYDDSGKHVFMLISTSGTAHCMRIDQNDWSGMRKNQSHINCQELYEYSPSELSHATPRGRLSDEALGKLMDHVAASETLTPVDIDFIIDAFQAYVEE